MRLVYRATMLAMAVVWLVSFFAIAGLFAQPGTVAHDIALFVFSAHD